jgi:hypothetical protein
MQFISGEIEESESCDQIVESPWIANVVSTVHAFCDLGACPAQWESSRRIPGPVALTGRPVPA